MDILRRVDHPNIIALHEMIEAGNKLYFVMELWVTVLFFSLHLPATHSNVPRYRVTGGELFDRIVEKGSYSEEDAKILVRKIVSAIDYLHKQNIAHRDLKVLAVKFCQVSWLLNPIISRKISWSRVSTMTLRSRSLTLAFPKSLIKIRWCKLHAAPRATWVSTSYAYLIDIDSILFYFIFFSSRSVECWRLW